MVNASPDIGDSNCGNELLKTNSVHVLYRFFCGPHAKKSAALAKQQKKKPKAKGKGKMAEDSGGQKLICGEHMLQDGLSQLQYIAISSTYISHGCDGIYAEQSRLLQRLCNAVSLHLYFC